MLHQAALGSVPRSLEDPVATNASNVDGFLNMLVAARDAGVARFVYAASSSTYGDHPGLPKVEDRIGRPLSPYAVTKYVNELYAGVFAQAYGLSSAGLRYFNVFGPRQDPDGAYAAVIPKWTAAMIAGETVFINGDGETSRDFCFVANAVQANLLAATSDRIEGHEVFNVAVGDRTSLNGLFDAIRESLEALAGPGRFGKGLPGLPRGRRAPQPGGCRQGAGAARLRADASPAGWTRGGDALVCEPLFSRPRVRSFVGRRLIQALSELAAGSPSGSGQIIDARSRSV